MSDTAHNQSGFSMLETLIAMTVFSLGFIGVAHYTGEALKRTADDNSRAISLHTMTQLVTPLYVSATQTPTDFKTALDLFATDTGRSISANNNRETYTVRVIEAKDDTGTSILNNASPDTWVSPITVGLTVSYTGATGSIVSKAPYTFLLSN